MEARRSLRESFGGSRVIWHNLYGTSCVGLAEFCPVEIVVCRDYGTEFDMLEHRTGATFLSQERETRRRICIRFKTIQTIDPDVSGKLKEQLGTGNRDRWVFISAHASPEWEPLIEEIGCRGFFPSFALYEHVSQKVNLFRGLAELGIAHLPGRWLSLAEARYSELARVAGATFVAQRNRGVSGLGTAIISSESDFLSAARRFGDEDVWVAPYMGTLSLNINGVALAGGAVAAYPNVQLTGISCLGSGPGQYCGNDYTATSALPRRIVDEVLDQTERIGNWLSSLGFRGLYGLDFVIDDSTGRPCAVDLNPRWQGSTPVLAQAQMRSGRLPLAAANVACGLGALSDQEVLRYKDNYREPAPGAMMVLRFSGDCDAKVCGEVRAGVYQTGSQLAFRRPGLVIGDCRESGEVLLTTGVPHQGTVVEPLGFLLKIMTQERVADLDKGGLLPWAEQTARQALEQLRLQPVRTYVGETG
jgi:hypothetical protein